MSDSLSMHGTSINSHMNTFSLGSNFLQLYDHCLANCPFTAQEYMLNDDSNRKVPQMKTCKSMNGGITITGKAEYYNNCSLPFY